MGSATVRIVEKGYPPVTVSGADQPVALARTIDVFYRPVSQGDKDGVIVFRYASGNRFVMPVRLTGRFDSTHRDWKFRVRVPTEDEMEGSGMPNVEDGSGHRVFFNSGNLETARFVVEAGVDPVSPLTMYDIENQAYILTETDKGVAVQGSVIIPAIGGDLYEAYGTDAVSQAEIDVVNPGDTLSLAQLMELRERFAQEDVWLPPGGMFPDGVGPDGSGTDLGWEEEEVVVEESGGGMMPLVLGAGALAAAMFLLG